MKHFNLDEYLDLLERLVNTESNSFDPDGIDNVASIMAEKYEELGLHVVKHRFDNRAGYCLEVRTHPKMKI